MKVKWFAVLLIMLMTAFSQTNTNVPEDSGKTKFITVSMDMKPYIDGGIHLVDKFYLIGSLGFYKGENDTYFRLGGGLQGFIRHENPIDLFIGTQFLFEVNPSVVYGGLLDSRMTLNGFAGGWVHLTKHIALDARVNLNLHFNHYPNNDTVEFGILTSALGVVFIF